jgi:hypothetical protein
MITLTVITVAFLCLESANVAALYLRPGSDKFNALGVFKAWEASKADPEVHDLVRYLAYWVAGTKLIFILLLGSVLIFGDDRMRVIAVAALVLAILSFFWRLGPLARQIDSRSQMNPAGYSRLLTGMIVIFLIALAIGVVVGAVAIR